MTSQSTNPSVTDYLRQLLNTQMNLSEISLDFRAISDLLPYVHLLSGFRRLKKLSLHGNRLKQLPTDLSMLSSIQTLDISNNFLDDNIQMTLVSLRTLPHLRSLIYPIPQAQCQSLIQSLTSLQYLNNIHIQRVQAKRSYSFNLLNPKTMSQYQNKLSSMYKMLLELQKKYLDQVVDGDAVDRFRQDIKAVSKEVLDKLDRGSQQASSSLQYVMLYMAKYEMLDHLKTKALNLCQDIYSDLGDFVMKIIQQQDQLFKFLSEQSLNLTRLQYDVKQRQQQQKTLSKQAGEYFILNKNLTMQKEIKRLRKQKQQLITQMSQVQNQNKKLLQTLTKYAKGDKSVLSNFTNQNTKQNPKSHSQIAQTTLPIPLGSSLNRIGGMRVSQKAPSHRAHPNSNYSTGGNRNLTLKQLKQTIQQIYQSKLKFDQKNYDGHIARETMHQYLFTYLNQKYGLKNLTIEAAASIVAGIQAYSAEDNDVSVFGKILRNQVDQEFRFVQTELKTTVTDLLKMHIKTKMPYKSANQINQILHDKMNNDILWQQSQDIVKYLYNKLDSLAILKKLQVLFKINQRPSQKPASRRLTRQQQSNLTSSKQTKRLKFSLFLKCILNFQLRNHQILLAPLISSFKNHDQNSDGIISQEQFISIIQDLCQQANDIIPYLLNVIDPYELKQVTFTQMVRLVANYPENRPILSRFVGKDDNEQDEKHNQQYI